MFLSLFRGLRFWVAGLGKVLKRVQQIVQRAVATSVSSWMAKVNQLAKLRIFPELRFLVKKKICGWGLPFFIKVEYS